MILKATIGTVSAGALTLGGLLYERLTGTMDATAQTLSSVAVLVGRIEERTTGLGQRMDRLESITYGD